MYQAEGSPEVCEAVAVGIPAVIRVESPGVTRHHRQLKFIVKMSNMGLDRRG